MTEFTEDERALIELLRADSRVPVAVLARRLRVPRVTLVDRINRLRKDGAIRRFTIVVDPEREGRGMTAFVQISLVRGEVDMRNVVDSVVRLAGVVEVHNVAGEPDLMVKVRGRNLMEIGEAVVNRIRAIPGVGATVTLPCFVTLKEEY